MKKLIALLMAATMCLSLCACGGNSFEPTTEEDKISYAILKQAVSDYKEAGENVKVCGPCKVYENYEGSTLVAVTLYEEGETGIGNRAYGLFDGTEIKEYIWFGTGISKMEELRKNTDKLDCSSFDVSKEVCGALNIVTDREMWKTYATTMACDYLMEFMDYLKNPTTIEVNAVYCYVKPYGVYQAGTLDEQIFFTVNYTAENSIGGKVTSTIGSNENGGLSLYSTKYANNRYADSTYFVKDETYAKKQSGMFSLDNAVIQEYILKNYNP